MDEQDGPVSDKLQSLGSQHGDIPGADTNENILYGAFVYAPEAPEYPNALGVVQANATTALSPQWTISVVDEYATPAFTPSIVSLNGVLYIAYGPMPNLFIVSSSDAQNWSSPTMLSPANRTTCSPALITFKNQLYLFYVGTNQTIGYTSSSNGTNWSSPGQLPGVTTTNFSPAVVVWNNTLYVIYASGANDGTIWITWSSDLNTWSGPFQLPPAITFGMG